MMDEEEQQITVLRRRRRNGHNSANGNSHANGHARSEREASGSGNWGWTKGKANPFSDSEDEPRSRRQTQDEPQFSRPRRREIGYKPHAQPAAEKPKIPFDPWRFYAALKRRWHWLVVGMLVLGAFGFWIADRMLKYKAPVTLMRRELNSAFSNGAGDPFQPRDISDQTLFSFMRSGEVLRRVVEAGAKQNPPVIVTLPELAKSVSVNPTPNPDALVLAVSGDSKSQRLVDIANIYAEEVVRYTRELQAAESGDVATYLQQKIAQIEQDLAAANAEIVKFSREEGFISAEKEAETFLKMNADLAVRKETAVVELETVRVQITGLESDLKNATPNDTKLKEAQEKLIELRTRFTDEHPAVIAQIRAIDVLQKNAASAGPTAPEIRTMGNAFGNSLYLQLRDFKAKEAMLTKQIAQFEQMQNDAKSRLDGLSEKGMRYGGLKAKVQALEAQRQLVAERQQRTKLFVESAMGYYRIQAPAALKDISTKNRTMKIAAVTIAGAMAGLTIALLLALFTEVVDTRLKTRADVERATGLPVLAELGDLQKMSPAEQINWAFRTLTILRGKLCETGDDALVCGFISSRHGEGRSTWVNLLVSAASQRGLRVLTVDTRPTSDGPRTEPFKKKEEPVAAAAPDAKKPEAAPKSAEEENANNVLTTPLAVMERLKDPNQEPVLHIPIPGWVWSLERRQKWQDALEQWREIENSVIFIELPPASNSEAILLAEKIPQLIWLTGSGMADVKETREHLETLRHARCNLVGAVLNQAPPPAVNNSFARWFSK